MSTTSPRASWPSGKATSVHWIQARRAFERASGAYAARIVEHDDATVVVERLSDRTAVTLTVGRPVHLTATLARNDVTRLDGLPLALVSEYFGVLGVATGPADPPPQLRVLSSVSRFEDGETVEIPNVDDSQPSWQLFAVRAVTIDDDEQQPEKPTLFLGKDTDRESIEAAAAAMVEVAYERAGKPLPEETKAELARRRAARHSNG